MPEDAIARSKEEESYRSCSCRGFREKEIALRQLALLASFSSTLVSRWPFLFLGCVLFPDTEE